MTDPHDEPLIGADEILIRRIDPIEHIVPNGQGGLRVSSKAFKPSSRPPFGMSVDVKGLIISAGIEPEIFVTTPKYQGSVAFPVSTVREVDLMVGYHPLAENPYHAEVWGKVRPDRFSPAQERALQSGCGWFVRIPGVDLR